MNITFLCTACGQHIEIEEAGAGLEVNCPTCNHALVVPRTSAQTPVVIEIQPTANTTTTASPQPPVRVQQVARPITPIQPPTLPVAPSRTPTTRNPSAANSEVTESESSRQVYLIVGVLIAFIVGSLTVINFDKLLGSTFRKDSKTSAVHDVGTAHGLESLQELKREPANPVTPVTAPAPPKEVPAGSIEYLDFKNGFRDVTFGQQRSAISGLTTIETKESLKCEQCKRGTDELSLNGLPLKEIKYTFFDGKLYEIQMSWEVEVETMYLDESTGPSISDFCASLYGQPTSSTRKPYGIGMEWRGSVVNLGLSAMSVGMFTS